MSLVDARDRDANTPPSRNWSAPAGTASTSGPKGDLLQDTTSFIPGTPAAYVAPTPTSFQNGLDIAAAAGRPVTSPADAAHPSAVLVSDHPGLTDAERAAAMRSFS